mgnify:FL=1|tara:strand:- start:156 stop:554 length:399 start_codon:yes stop_codon:yes gene_type:complete
MADTIQFDLVSLEKLVASQPVEMVVVPGSEGDMGVLPGHSLLIGTIRPGVIDVHEGGNVTNRIFVSGGFVQVDPETCTVLADEAVAVADIDKAAATDRLQSAQKALADAGDDTRADAEAEVKVAEALVAAAG